MEHERNPAPGARAVGPPPGFFASLERGGRVTQIVGIRRPWDPRDPVLEAARAAARRGLSIQRDFLLVHRSQRDDPGLVEQRKLDHEAGIATRLHHAGPWVERLHATAPGGLEFGLFDDARCGTWVTGEGDDAARVVAWRESREPGTVARARAFFGRLDREVPSVDAEPGTDLPEDPVLLIVPAVEAAAPDCHVDPETGRWCRAFHLPRAWFRVLGAVGTNFAHRELYERGLAPVFERNPRPRILITGTADHALFALLHFLAARAGVEAEITVSDLCPTPLAATRRYAQLVGARVATVAADAVGLAELGPFDAICTHLLYGWIRPDRRPALVRSWASLLRPGGRVVTNASVWRGDGPSPPRDRREQFARFNALVLERARAWKDVLGVDPERAHAMAAEFLPHWRSRFPRSRPEEIEAVFAGAGLDVELEVRGRTALVRPDWNPAPELERAPRPERGEAWITAVRPG